MDGDMTSWWKPRWDIDFLNVFDVRFRGWETIVYSLQEDFFGKT